jgi:hypothetical protein
MSGAYVNLRPVRGVEDIEYNFQVVLGVLTDFSGDYIQAATIPSSAFRDPLITQNGDAVLGELSCALLEVTGATTLASLSVSGTTTLAATTVNGEPASVPSTVTIQIDAALVPYLLTATAAATYRTLAASYSDAETDAAILAALPGVATTTEEGIVLQAAAVADLNASTSEPVSGAAVDAIADKVDELMAALRAAGLLAT